MSASKTKQAKWGGPRVGMSVFIRTVTMHYTGKVIGIDKDFIHLAEAAWVADSGRFSVALATGNLNEVEPYPGAGYVSVGRGGLIDVSPWVHDLPRTTK